MQRRVGLFVVAALLAALGPVATPTVAPAMAADAADASVPTGRIAFTVATSGNDGGEIWTIERDGSNPHALTTGYRDTDPMFSPTGRQVAFTRVDGGVVPDDPDDQRRIHVYVMNSDGSGVRQLARNDMQSAYSVLGWSSDGQEVFTTGMTRQEYHEAPPDDNGTTVYALGIGGGQRRLGRITYDDFSCGVASVSPSRRAITACHGKVYVGGSAIQLSSPALTDTSVFGVAFAGERQFLLVNQPTPENLSRDIYLAPAGGGAATKITTPSRVTTNVLAHVDEEGTPAPAGCTYDTAYVAGLPDLAPGGELIALPIGTYNGDPDATPRTGACPNPEPTGWAGASGLGTLSPNGGDWRLLYRPGAGWSVLLQSRVSVQCTPGNCLTGLMIQAVPDSFGGGGFPVTFHYTVTVGTSTSHAAIRADGDLFHQPGAVLVRVPAGTATVTEAPAAAWHLDELSCDPVATSVDLGAKQATVQLGVGAMVLCTFRSHSGQVPDTDADSVNDLVDNCIFDVNPGQADSNGDGTGDACQPPADPVRPPPDRDKLVCGVEISGLDWCNLQPGDIIVDRSPDGSLARLHALGGTYYTHAAIVVANPDYASEPDLNLPVAIVEAVPDRVTLGEFNGGAAINELGRPIPFKVIRPGVSKAARNAAAAFALTQVGKPYSPFGRPVPGRFGTGPDAYYCSGLVWRAYKEAGYDLADGPRLRLFPFISPDKLASKNSGGSVDRSVIDQDHLSGFIAVAALTGAGGTGTVGGAAAMVTDSSGNRLGTDAEGMIYQEIEGATMIDGPEASPAEALFEMPGMAKDWTLTLSAGPTGAELVVNAGYAGDERQTSPAPSVHLEPGEIRVITLGQQWPEPPSASLAVTITGPLSVALDASTSSAGSAQMTAYMWDYEGDGLVDEVTSGPTTTHTYPDAVAQYTPRVRVRDAGGLTSGDASTLYRYPGEGLRGRAWLTAARPVADPAELTFTAHGFGASGVDWDFDRDGTIDDSSAGPSIVHAFASHGSYVVRARDAADPMIVADLPVDASDPLTVTVVDDEVDVPLYGRVSIDPLVNDDDPDRQIKSTTFLTGLPPDAIDLVVRDGTLMDIGGLAATPDPQTLTYSFQDLSGNFYQGTVTVHVVGVANRPPEAVLTAYGSTGPAPFTTTLDAGQSSDPDGDALSYAWDLDGDGTVDQTTSIPTVQHQFADAGTVIATVTVVDGYDETSTASLPIMVTGAVPGTGAAPGVSVAALARYTTGTAVTLQATGTPGGAAIVNYDARYRRASRSGSYGAYVYPASWQGAVSGTFPLTLARGYTYCLGARSRDADGQVSGWVEQCTISPVDDRSMTASRGWSRISGSAYVAGTATRTASSGRKLTLKNVQTRRIAIVATTCASCGKVRVYWNGTLKKTVSLVSSRTRYRVVLPAVDLGSVRSGTIVIQTVNGRRVTIDGVAVGRL